MFYVICALEANIEGDFQSRRQLSDFQPIFQQWGLIQIFCCSNTRFSHFVLIMRTTPSQNGHVTDLLFLDEAYEKMACIYCQGNPILSLINKLLVMIGPALVKNQATF